MLLATLLWTTMKPTPVAATITSTIMLRITIVATLTAKHQRGNALAIAVTTMTMKTRRLVHKLRPPTWLGHAAPRPSAIANRQPPSAGPPIAGPEM